MLDPRQYFQSLNPYLGFGMGMNPAQPFSAGLGFGPSAEASQTPDPNALWSAVAAPSQPPIPSMPGAAPTMPPGGAGGPAAPPDWLARLLGGGDPAAQGVLGPQDQRAARNAALFQTGLALLAGSGPQPVKQPLGVLIARALQQGQQSYQGYTQNAVQNRAIAGQEAQQRILAGIQQKYAGQPLTVPVLQSMLKDYVGANQYQIATPLEQYLQSLTGDSGANGQVTTILNTPGQPMHDPTYDPGTSLRVLYDPKTGERIRTLGVAPAAYPDFMGVRNDISMMQGLSSLGTKFLDRPDVKPIVAFDNSYQNLMNGINAMRAGDQTTLGPVISAFAHAMEPGNRFQLGMLHYAQQNLGASAGMTFDQLVNKYANGVLPPGLLDQMQKDAEAMRQRNISNYNYKRAGELKRHADLKGYDKYVPPYDEMISAVNGGAPGSTPGSPATPWDGD